MAYALSVASWYIIGKILKLAELLSEFHSRFRPPQWMSEMFRRVVFYLFLLELSKLGVFGERAAQLITEIFG